MKIVSEKIAGTPLILKRHNEGYWQVTIDDPPLNIFGLELLTGLEEVVRRMQTAPELRVVVFDSAAPDFFIAHFDMVRGSEVLTHKTASGLLPWFDVAQALHELPVVSIAVIRGRARGVGIEFSAACDIRFASEKAIFGQFEVGSSAIPGGGSMELLPLLVGRARALEMIIGGEDLDAKTAETYGLVNRLIPDSELDAFVHRLALRISRFDPVITRQAKTMINQRAAKPSMNHMAESRAVFIQALARPERKPISEKMRKWGIQQDSDFERNLGAYFNEIGEETTSKQF
jgi:enoyl-CoA hydratase/carnithine racemase